MIQNEFKTNNSYFYGGILVTFKGRVVKIIPITHAPVKEFDTLEIIAGREGEEQKVEKIEYNQNRIRPNIKIDRGFLTVKLNYALSNILIDTVEIQLIDESIQIGDIDPLEFKYQQALKIVSDAVSDYGPTPQEKEEHYELQQRSVVDHKAKSYMLEFIGRVLHSCKFLSDIDEVEHSKYKSQIFAQLYGLGILQPLNDDPDVGEILVNASKNNFHCDVYYIKNQIKYKYDKTFKSERELKAICERILAFENKSTNAIENNMVEATSPQGDRINLIIPDASDNYLLNIRKFSNFLPDLNSMYTTGTIDNKLDKLIKVLVNGKTNIGIGGPMGTGKTTMINFMLTYTPPIERKIIIASVSEMDTDRVLKGHDVGILKVDEKKKTTFDSLLKASLRTTADRVIIPESRGGEFKALYEANLKTKGNMFTAHAMDAEGFLNVCTDMYMSSPDSGNESSEYIKNKLVRAIDIIIIMRRVGNLIRIQSVSEVVANKDGGFDHINDLYYWNYDKENPLEGHYSATGNVMTAALVDRINSAGVPYSSILETNKMLEESFNNEFLQGIQ